MSLPRSFLLISSNLNSTWCLYLNEENVSQAFRHAEMESTILLQQQTSSNVDTWSKIKSINILLLQGTFTAVSCRVRLCKFQVIKRPGREEFCRCGGIPSKVPRQNPISTIRHIFSSELSREIRTIDALLSPPAAALSFSPDSNRTQKLNAVCVCVCAMQTAAGDKIVEKRLCCCCATLRRTSERERKDWICRRRLRRSSDHAIIYQDEIEEGREGPRPVEGGREQPKFPSPSLPPRLVKESFNLSPTTTSIDLFKEAQREAVLR